MRDNEEVTYKVPLLPSAVFFGNPEPGDVAVVWSYPGWTFEFTLTQDGKIDWFFRDRETDEYDGSEEPEDSLSEKAMNYLLDNCTRKGLKS